MTVSSIYKLKNIKLLIEKFRTFESERLDVD